MSCTAKIRLDRGAIKTDRRAAGCGSYARACARTALQPRGCRIVTRTERQRSRRSGSCGESAFAPARGWMTPRRCGLSLARGNTLRSGRANDGRSSSRGMRGGDAGRLCASRAGPPQLRDAQHALLSAQYMQATRGTGATRRRAASSAVRAVFRAPHASNARRAPVAGGGIFNSARLSSCLRAKQRAKLAPFAEFEGAESGFARGSRPARPRVRRGRPHAPKWPARSADPDGREGSANRIGPETRHVPTAPADSKTCRRRGARRPGATRVRANWPWAPSEIRLCSVFRQPRSGRGGGGRARCYGASPCGRRCVTAGATAGAGIRASFRFRRVRLAIRNNPQPAGSSGQAGLSPTLQLAKNQ
eukprot:350905-Chlamydomonas_euryale.AAC.12